MRPEGISKARLRKVRASSVRSGRNTDYPGARERGTRSDSGASLYPSIPGLGCHWYYPETDRATTIHATPPALFCPHTPLGDYRGHYKGASRSYIPKDAIISRTRRGEDEDVITTSRQLDTATDCVLVPGGWHGAFKCMECASLWTAEGHRSGVCALMKHRNKV